MNDDDNTPDYPWFDTPDAPDLRDFGVANGPWFTAEVYDPTDGSITVTHRASDAMRLMHDARFPAEYKRYPTQVTYGFLVPLESQNDLHHDLRNLLRWIHCIESAAAIKTGGYNVWHDRKFMAMLEKDEEKRAKRAERAKRRKK